MDVNKLTQKTQEAIQNAQNIAARLQQVELDVEHVLMALLEQADGLIPRILAKMDIPVDTVVSEVHK
ncbi:MAG TPA: Clp protease N-terminal domain-containing protein, partial [Deltaproteobacteria bacterium]|nr:Clp protease N-terminal domain-containing protein [Deltaproteobacteria bacterium]